MFTKPKIKYLNLFQVFVIHLKETEVLRIFTSKHKASLLLTRQALQSILYYLLFTFVFNVIFQFISYLKQFFLHYIDLIFIFETTIVLLILNCNSKTRNVFAIPFSRNRQVSILVKKDTCNSNNNTIQQNIYKKT